MVVKAFIVEICVGILMPVSERLCAILIEEKN